MASTTVSLSNMKTLILTLAAAASIQSADAMDLWGMTPDNGYCMAYWTGFVINTDTGKCEARSASGCANPFVFESRAECDAVARGH